MHLNSLPLTTVTSIECHPAITNQIPASFINPTILESIDSKYRNFVTAEKLLLSTKATIIKFYPAKTAGFWVLQSSVWGLLKWRWDHNQPLLESAWQYIQEL